MTVPLPRSKWPYNADRSKYHALPDLDKHEQAAWRSFTEDYPKWWLNNKVVLKYSGLHGSAFVQISSICTLVGQEWLNDEIITYLSALARVTNEEENKKNPDASHKVLIFDSYFLSTLLQEEDISHNWEYKFSKSIQNTLKKKTRYISAGQRKYTPPMHYDKLIFTLNYCHSHWVTICVFPKTSMIELYDSSGGQDELYT